jgi:hypothetical protein
MAGDAGAVEAGRAGPASQWAQSRHSGGRPVASEAAAWLGWLAEPCPERAEEEPAVSPYVLEVHGEVVGLLGQPVAGRMGGDAEDVDLAVGMFK